MADDSKATKAAPAAKSEGAAKDKSTAAEGAKAEPAAKSEGAAKDKSTPAEGAKAGGGETAAAPANYSRGEGQKPVTKAYKENWNAIFAKKTVKTKTARTKNAKKKKR